jgi:hypothetical protein
MPRIIYSLKFDLKLDVQGPTAQLIVPLDTRGQSPFCEAILPIERVIDLRPGDEVWHTPAKRAYVIKSIEAYRDNRISWEQMEAGPPTDGYVVRGAR